MYTKTELHLETEAYKQTYTQLRIVPVPAQLVGSVQQQQKLSFLPDQKPGYPCC